MTKDELISTLKTLTPQEWEQVQKVIDGNPNSRYGDHDPVNSPIWSELPLAYLTKSMEICADRLGKQHLTQYDMATIEQSMEILVDGMADFTEQDDEFDYISWVLEMSPEEFGIMVYENAEEVLKDDACEE